MVIFIYRCNDPNYDFYCRVDGEGSSTLLNCMMYKMCYYRFGQVYTEGGKPPGYDRVRNAEIGNKDFELDVLEEAYTSEHWIVRIYKVCGKNNSNGYYLFYFYSGQRFAESRHAITWTKS